MPIIVSHTPVGAIGRAALLAGQAQASQLQANRDIQLTSMSLAAQNQQAQLAAAERAQERSYALQQANAAAMARQRPAEPDALAQRQKLRRAVSEAEASGVYEPAQLKQMQIFANLGDEQAVRSILGRVAESTPRQRELERQTKALDQITQVKMAPLAKQLGQVETALNKRFAPEAQQMLRENPQFADEETQTLFAQQDQLRNQIADITGQTDQMKRQLQLGLSMADQMAIERQRQIQLEKQEETEQKRLITLTREAGKLSDQEELVIDTMRDQEREKRTALQKEIDRLSKDLAPLQDETPEDTILRNAPTQVEIRVKELEQIASYASEKKQIEGFLRRGQTADNIPKTYVLPDGRKFEFQGQYRNGEPWYEPVNE